LCLQKMEGDWAHSTGSERVDRVLNREFGD
jgi:hypothetical protein